MSGHSKWSTIKRKKGAIDAKRGKIFTRLIKEITVAARAGGGDPEGNPRLRTAVATAKTENMPKDNIARAIKKGTGEIAGEIYDEIMYEGYGPGGVAVLVECMTDNRNRTVADVRHAFTKHGGNLGTDGSVAFLFKHCGLMAFAPGTSEEKLMEAAIEAGADRVYRVNHADELPDDLTGTVGVESPTAVTFPCVEAKPETRRTCAWFVSWYSSTRTCWKRPA